MRPEKDNQNTAILTKDSSEQEIKSYFDAVLKLSQSGKEFPINFDEVWLLAFTRKNDAVKALKRKFIEGVDFQSLSQNPQRGGSSPLQYWLTPSCLEFFIARKVRPVFEVYRKVFHHVVQKQIEGPGAEKKQMPDTAPFYLQKEGHDMHYGIDGERNKGKLLWKEEVTFSVEMYENTCYNSVSKFVSSRSIREIKQVVDRLFYVVTGEMP